MTSRGRSLSVNITGDADKLKRELAQAQRAVKEAERDLAKMGVTQGSVARSGDGLTSSLSRQDRMLGNLRSRYMGYTAALAAGGVVVAGAIKTSISLASAYGDLDESLSKNRVIFREHADGVARWSENTATAFGQSRREAVAATGDFGNLFNTVGLAPEVNAQMSMSLVQLSADLASFHNLTGGAAEAQVKLRAGLVGEAEPLRTLGVLISAANVERKAMELGLGRTSKELSEEDKVLARYHLILEQSASAQGDFARTSDSLANESRTLGAQIDNLRVKIGEELYDDVTESTEAMNKFLDENSEEIARGIAGGIEAMATSLGNVLTALDLIRQSGPVKIVFELSKMGSDQSASVGGVDIPFNTNPIKDWWQYSPNSPGFWFGTVTNALSDGEAGPRSNKEATALTRDFFSPIAVERARQAAEGPGPGLPGMFDGGDFGAQSDLDRLRSRSERAAFERDMARIGDANKRKFATAAEEEAEKARTKAIRGAAAGPDAFSGSNLSLIDRALSGVPEAFSGTPSVREFEQAEREFAEARKALNRDLAMLGLTMADLDAQGQENSAGFKGMEERAAAMQDAVKRIDLIEDLQLTPFRDAIAATRDAIEAATEAERARTEEMQRTMQSIGEQARGDTSMAIQALAAAGVTDPAAYQKVAGQIHAATVDPAQRAILDAQRLGLIDAGQGMGLLNELRVGLSPKSPLDDLKELLGLGKPGQMGSGVGGGGGYIDRAKTGVVNYGTMEFVVDGGSPEDLMRTLDRLAE